MKGKLAAVVVIGLAAAYVSGQHATVAGATSRPASGPAATAIAYARAQIGRPYRWGGTGPDAFDCSGLAMMAYRSAGIDITRTSQEQWASGPRTESPEPGDLVFFAGGDGTVAEPGHVGLVTGPHRMIEAYGYGYPIRVSTFGLPSSPEGDQDPVGFTDPAAAR